MPDVTEKIVSSQTQITTDFWINAAHGAVRRYCGWHVAPLITHTLTLDGPGGTMLMIPSMRVVELGSVVSGGVDVTAHVDTSRAGMLRLTSGCWSDRFGGVEITLTHGYEVDEVPDVAAIILGLAKRGPNTGSTISSQSVNGASVGYVTSGGAPVSIPLLQVEKEALGPYRTEWGVG